MKHFNSILSGILLGIGCTMSCQNLLAQSLYPHINDNKVVVAPRASILMYDFKLNEVTLGEGVLKQAMELNRKWLLDLNPNRLLHRFHLYANLDTQAPIYGGWESEKISGHTLGHYLSACSMQYSATNEQEFKARVDYMVGELDRCQQQYKGVMTGYVGGIPEQERIFTEISTGNLYSSGFDLNGGWVPMYTLHKLYAGLIDAYLYTDNQQAKEVVMKLADWLIQITKSLSEQQFQQLMACEFGGMNDAMTALYALTGEQKYQDLAQRFYHEAVLNPLAERKDQLQGLHANTQVPKIIGCASLYWITGEQRMLDISSFFWETVVHHHSYANGGNSDFEHFTPPNQICNHQSTNSTETCNTYNMLKLTKKLYSFSGEAALMEYYERALYNHILCSQHPETGMVTYYMNHLSGGRKAFSSPFDAFWCCVGSGIENHVKYAESIYAHDANHNLYLNLFAASALHWKARGMTIEQTTDFPYTPGTRLKITEGSKGKFKLFIRQPQWLAGEMTLRVNNRPYPAKQEQKGYLTIDRTWKKGDIVEVALPMKIHTMATPDCEDHHAFFYGPVLLAAELTDNRDAHEPIPVVVSDDKMEYEKKIVPTNLAKLEFESKGLAQTKELKLKPFFAIYDKDYAVYLKFFNPQTWAIEYEAYLKRVAREKALSERSTDDIRFDMQSERDHQLTGENTHAGKVNAYNWRDARDGGYFQFTLATKKETRLQLSVDYWGRDGGNRSFNIRVDETVIANQTLTDKGVDDSYNCIYNIPEELLIGKEKVTIRFQALPQNSAGGVLGCRLLKR